jgi:hypothetical protein
MNFLSKHSVLLVFLLAIAVRLACLATHPEASLTPKLYDAGRYNAFAENLLDGEGLEYKGQKAQVSTFIRY